MARIVEPDGAGEDPSDHRPVRLENDRADVADKNQDEQDEEEVVQPVVAQRITVWERSGA